MGNLCFCMHDPFFHIAYPQDDIFTLALLGDAINVHNVMGSTSDVKINSLGNALSGSQIVGIRRDTTPDGDTSFKLVADAPPWQYQATPLQFAILIGEKDTVEALLEYQADPLQQSQQGFTAMDMYGPLHHLPQMDLIELLLLDRVNESSGGSKNIEEEKKGPR
eukprot:PhF_6_TR12477/c0_g1_i1/m.19613